ncbi:MAG TPA: FAD-dependent oxidoreductase [Candidatus Dormibacteraeota bacterium]|nr:FAD-dependent oxidoreductase [Candidatus Dormibacteraeota bacterium]
MSTPFWAPPPEKYPGRMPDKADVLIIGGGIAGTSLLWHLARRRIDAVLLERNHLAWGASGRNAGFLLAGVASSYAEAVSTYGRQQAREVWEVTNENHDRMLEAARGMSVGHRRLGSAIVPASDGERALLIESEQLLLEDGFQARWDGSRLVNPRDGEIDPAAMVAALGRQARDGAIREGVNIVSLESRRHGVTVTSDAAAQCDAGVVIVATNAYTPQLLPNVKIQPTRAQMVATAPDPNPIADMPVYSNFGYRYWRQRATGEVLLGGWRDTSLETEKTYDDDPTAEIQAHLDRALSDLHVTAEVTHRWAGTMGFTESGLPLAGPVDGMPNLYLCAGFTGHGMGFAFMTAKRVAESI